MFVVGDVQLYINFSFNKVVLTSIFLSWQPTIIIVFGGCEMQIVLDTFFHTVHGLFLTCSVQRENHMYIFNTVGKLGYFWLLCYPHTHVRFPPRLPQMGMPVLSYCSYLH